MHQDHCREIARAAAVACHERHDYMPPTPLLAEVWHPHQWVVDAMLLAAHAAERERDRYKAAEIQRLAKLAESKGTRAVIHLRRARKAETLLREVLEALPGLQAPNCLGMDLYQRIGAALGPN